MIRIIRFLIWGIWYYPDPHICKYEELEQINISSNYDEWGQRLDKPQYVGKRYILKCKECGDITSRKIGY